MTALIHRFIAFCRLPSSWGIKGEGRPGGTSLPVASSSVEAKGEAGFRALEVVVSAGDDGVRVVGRGGDVLGHGVAGTRHGAGLVDADSGPERVVADAGAIVLAALVLVDRVRGGLVQVHAQVKVQRDGEGLVIGFGNGSRFGPAAGGSEGRAAGNRQRESQHRDGQQVTELHDTTSSLNIGNFYSTGRPVPLRPAARLCPLDQSRLR